MEIKIIQIIITENEAESYESLMGYLKYGTDIPSANIKVSEFEYVENIKEAK